MAKYMFANDYEGDNFFVELTYEQERFLRWLMDNHLMGDDNDIRIRNLDAEDFTKI